MKRTTHKVTWFAPERPVENGTVYVRPAGWTLTESEARAVTSVLTTAGFLGFELGNRAAIWLIGRDVGPVESDHEVTCPNPKCGATIRARMADQPESDGAFMRVQDAIETAIRGRGVEPPNDLADICYVAATAVMGLPRGAGPAAEEETQWCAFYGGPDPDNAAGLEVFTGDDGEACAREEAHWRIDSGIATRTVSYGPWTVQPLSTWSDGERDDRFNVPEVTLPSAEELARARAAARAAAAAMRHTANWCEMAPYVSVPLDQLAGLLRAAADEAEQIGPDWRMSALARSLFGEPKAQSAPTGDTEADQESGHDHG